MVLKLYGTSEAGSSTSIVALVLAEKQIPFEHIVVESSQLTKTIAQDDEPSTDHTSDVRHSHLRDQSLPN